MIDHLSTTPALAAPTGLAESRFCTACGYQNPGASDFCLNCNAALGTNCPMCGQAVPAGHKFCSHCGAPVSDQPQAGESDSRREEVLQELRALMPAALAQKISAASGDISGQQREVTVLDVSLQEVSRPAATFEEEEIFFLKDELLRLLVDVVYKYEGTVDRFTEDGLLALFGAPVAHENDPERAVRAALDMQRSHDSWLTHQDSTAQPEFRLCCSLNTGQVVAGKVGNDLHMEYTVVGETVNLAVDQKIAAAPGGVLVSATTYQFIQPLFECVALPPFRRGGQAEPMRTYQVINLRPKPDVKYSLSNFQTRMIGRACELTQLQNALAEVQQDRQNRVVLITGEAGLGKSRLVAEFRRSLSRPEIKVYQGGCLTYIRSTPLAVVAAILRDMLQQSDTAPAQLQLEALPLYLDRLGLAQQEILPYLCHVLGLEQIDPQAEARLALLDATMLQRQTHAALRQVFLSEAKPGPLVLIFEDLQWLDPASKDFLHYLIQTTADAPLLLVLVSRHTERESALSLLRAGWATAPERWLDLALQPLSGPEGQLLADQLISQTSLAAQALKQQIVHRAAGNPFYIEEIIRTLIDRGGLVRQPSDGSWQVTEQADELLKTVPGTVKGLILARFDRLPESVRQVLQTAAVLGTSFPVSLLQALAQLPLETLETFLAELEARQFLQATPFRAETGYVFSQALTQESIYSTLLKRDRRKLHLRTAQAVEASSLWLAEERAEVLAYHYAESTTPAAAVPHLISAAENAARRCAYETALEHYGQARVLLSDPLDAPSDQFFQIGLGLASALKFVGEFAEANEVLVETLQSVWHWDLAVDPEALGRILVESFHQLADLRQHEGVYEAALTYLEMGLQVLGEAARQTHPKPWRLLLDRMAWIRFRQGQLAEAFSLASTATASLDSKEAEDPAVLASLHNTLGGLSWQQGQLAEAITYVEQSLHLYENIGYLWGMATAYGNLGILSFSSGSWDRAATYYEQAYAVQQVIGNPQGQAISLDNLGILHTAMGQHERAQQELESSLAIRQRMGDAWGTAQAQVNLAHLAVIRSDFKEASKYADSALALADTIGSSEARIEARWAQALIRLENNDLPLAFFFAQEALEMAQAAGLMEKQADCLRVLGLLDSRVQQYDEAETALLTSVDLSKKQNDPYRQGQALSILGQMYQARAQSDPSAAPSWRAKAVTALSRAIQIFEALGAVHDLKLAQTVLGHTELS